MEATGRRGTRKSVAQRPRRMGKVVTRPGGYAARATTIDGGSGEERTERGDGGGTGRTGA